MNKTANALAPDTLEYATCLWARDVSNVRAGRGGKGQRGKAHAPHPRWPSPSL